eukprot:TRINITY_DN50857_c0_g1_i2.p1 TRINITY_DN50857_c0_g1~~TRINITY_DN50857_c0_g1_i2.p1  ORF type:complete len:288 (+),score=48.23 TRINITY_DN50857_c0_g1_i2:89-952(+)
MGLPSVLDASPKLSWSCAGADWKDLRIQVSYFSGWKPDLPLRVFHFRPNSPDHRKKIETRAWDGKKIDLQYGCPPGMWALRLLVDEMELLKARHPRQNWLPALEARMHFKVRDAQNTSAGSSSRRARRAGAKNAKALKNLLQYAVEVSYGAAGTLLFQPGKRVRGLPGDMSVPTWFELGLLDWSLFRLLRRLRCRVLSDASVQERKTVITLLEAALGNAWTLGQRTFAQAAERLASLEGGSPGAATVVAKEVRQAPTSRALREVVDDVQALLLNWFSMVKLPDLEHA